MENRENDLNYFLRWFCFASAEHLELGLNKEQLFFLYKECLEMARLHKEIRLQMFCCCSLGFLCKKINKNNDSCVYFMEMCTHMELCKQIHFVKFVAAFPLLQPNLSKEQLVCLLKECFQMGKYYYNDSNLKFLSSMLLVHLLMAISQYDEGLMYLKEMVAAGKRLVDTPERLSIYYEQVERFVAFGRYEAAFLCSEECASMANRIGEKQIEMKTYLKMVEIFFAWKQYENAILYSNKCNEIAKKISDKHVELNTYLWLAKAYESLDQCDKVASYCNEAIILAKSIGDELAERSAYLLLGKMYQTMQQYADAIKYCNKCIDISIEHGDSFTEIKMNAYLVLAKTYESLGRHEDAISYSERCLAIARERGEKRVEMECYFVLANTYEIQKQYDNALYFRKKCIGIAVEAGDKDATRNAYFLISNTSRSMKQFSKVIVYGKQIIEISRQNKDKQAQMVAYLSVGVTYLRELHQYQEAIQYTRDGLDIAKESGEKQIEMSACLMLGRAHNALNQYNDAIDYSKQCRDIAKKTGNTDFEVKSYSLSGLAYFNLNKFVVAVDHFSQGLEVAKAAQNGNAIEECNFFLHFIYDVVGMQEKASTYDPLDYLLGHVRNNTNADSYKSLLNLCLQKRSHEDTKKSTADLEKAGELLDQIATDGFSKSVSKTIQRVLHHPDKKSVLQQVIEDIEQQEWFGPKDLTSFMKYTLASMYMSIDRYHKALKLYQDGLAMAIKHCDKLRIAKYNDQMGSAFYRLGEMKEAELSLRESIRYYDIVYSYLEEYDEYKIAFLDTFVNCYKVLLVVLIQTNQIQEALLVSESYHAKSLKELLFSKYGIQQRPNNEEMKYLDIESLVTRNEYSILLYTEYPVRVLIFVAEVGDSELQFSFESFGGCKQIDMLIEDSFGEMQVRQVVTCENRSLDLSEDSEITKKISNEFDGLKGEEHLPSERCRHVPYSRGRGQSLECNEGKGTNNALESLFRKLLYKVSIHQEEIVIIPDGNLYKVPFAALQDPDTGLYLSETKRIRLAPSITTLKLLQEFPADYHCKKGALIVGDPLVGKVIFNGEERDMPPLESADAEARVIAYRLDVTPLIGKDATKQAVIERLKQGVSVIHIAAHGDESKATIALAPSPETRAKKIPDEEDYMLTMADVQKAQVRAQLVVLSCCHSGRGEIRAEGVVGMCRAFLASGARAVVASLWAIDDDATLQFMSQFNFYLKTGKSASTSLHLTMNEMRNTSNYNKPKYWAPFFLMGDDVTIKL